MNEVSLLTWQNTLQRVSEIKSTGLKVTSGLTKPTELAETVVFCQNKRSIGLSVFKWTVHMAMCPILFCSIKKPGNLVATDVGNLLVGERG